MSLLSGLKRKAARAAINLGGPLILKEIDRSLSSGEHGEEAMKFWDELKKFMNGKKTYTGAALIAMPAVMTAIAAAITEAGGDPVFAAKVAAWGGGTALFVLGVLHKITKWLDDQTPDNPDTTE